MCNAYMTIEQTFFYKNIGNVESYCVSLEFTFLRSDDHAWEYIKVDRYKVISKACLYNLTFELNQVS